MISVNRLTTLILGCLIFLLSGCFKDYEQYSYKVADWEPLLAAPLVTATLGMDDIVKNSGGNIVTDSSSGLVHLVYESELISANAADYLDIADQELASVLNFSMPGLLPGDTLILAFGDPVEFNFPSDERIDSMQVNAIFKINLVSDVNHSGKIMVELPFVICNGEALTFELEHTYTGTLPVIINTSVDLTGCRIYLSPSGGGSKNTIQPNYRFELYGDNDPTPGSFTVEMNDKLEQIRFVNVFGNLSEYSEQLRDVFSIGIFDKVDVGEVDLEEIILNIEVDNSFGLPIRIKPNEIWASSSVNPPYKVNITDLPATIDIQAPPVSAAGSFARSSIQMSSHDIIDAFKMAPQLVYYDFTATLNPPGSSGYNFILDTSEIRFRFKVDLPLVGRVGGLVLQDTMSLNVDDFKEAKSVSLRLLVENTFPLEVGLQAYFVGAGGIITDSLFTNMTTLLPAGIIGNNPDKRVVTPGRKVVDVVLSEAKLDAFLATTDLIIKGQLRTAGQDLVRIYEDYEIRLKIGATAQLSININD